MSRIAEEREFFREHPGSVFDETWHDIARNVQFAVENYRACEPELKELYPDHWMELDQNHDTVPMDVDYELYRNINDAGHLHVVTARHADSLIGYVISIIRPHLHHKSTMTAFTDMFYLMPDYRVGTIGYRLLKFMRDSVKERGVKQIYAATKLKYDVGPLLVRLGFNAVERTYNLVFP